MLFRIFEQIRGELFSNFDIWRSGQGAVKLRTYQPSSPAKPKITPIRKLLWSRMEQIKIYSAHLPPAERHLSRHWPKNRDPVPGQRQTGSAASRISLVWGTPAGAAPSRWSLAGKYYARARIVGLKSYRLVSVVSSCRKCSVR